MSLLLPGQIAQIYAAAAEVDGLDRMASTVRAIMNVDSAGLWLIESGQIKEISVTDDIAESLPPYLAYYQTLDPWTGARPKLINRVLASWEIFDENKLVASEFYNDFARHFGIMRPLGMVVDVAPGMFASVSTNRLGVTKLLSDEDKPLIAELGAHLRGALKLFQHLRTRDQAGSINGDALDRFAFGALICDSESRILQINRAALAQAKERAGLRIGGAREGIMAERPAETPRLRDLIRHAAGGRSGALRLTGAGPSRLAVLATPLLTDDHAALADGRVLLCLSHLDGPPALSGNTLSEMFGLSPAQTVLCMRLACGSTFEEAATERGIAMSTARTHFKAILAKTETRNLRDLLRLLATIPAMTGGL